MPGREAAQRQLFVDGIGTIAIIGQTVRFDLIALSSVERDGNGQPTPALLQRVIMTADGFLSSMAKLQSAADALSQLAAKTAAAKVAAVPRGAPEAPVEPGANADPIQTTAKRPFP